MKLSKYFCPWCEGVRLEFRDMSGSAPNGAGSAQMRGIVLGCPLAQVTGCPDATGACATEAEAEAYAAHQSKIHGTPSSEVLGLYAGRFEDWSAGANPRLLAQLTTPAPRQPLYVFAVPAVFPGEFSAEAENEADARLVIWTQLTPEQREDSDGIECLRVYPPEAIKPEMLPMGLNDFANAYSDWKGAQTIDFYQDARYPHHEGALRAAQAKEQGDSPKKWEVMDGESEDWRAPTSEIHPVSMWREICEEGEVIGYAVGACFSTLDQYCDKEEELLDKRALLMSKSPELVAVLKALMASHVKHVKTPHSPAYDNAARLIKEIEADAG